MLALYHPLLGECRSEQAVGGRRVDAGRRRLETAEGEPRGPGGQPYLRRALRSPSRTARWCARWRVGLPVGRRGGLCARRQGTTSTPRARATCVEYGPCLILIDEWVAYARHDESDLPAGSFETQFTFAQALTESVKQLPGNCLPACRRPPGVGHARPACVTSSGASSRLVAAGQRRRGVRDRPTGGYSSRSPTKPGSRTATSSPAPSLAFYRGQSLWEKGDRSPLILPANLSIDDIFRRGAFRPLFGSSSQQSYVGRSRRRGSPGLFVNVHHRSALASLGSRRVQGQQAVIMVRCKP